jgi:hypothetical protein
MQSRSKAGRPRFQPTQQQRDLVRVLKSCGITHPAISEVLSVPLRTVERYFKKEISSGGDVVKARIGAGIVRAALDGNLTAAMFYMRTQGGWSTRHELTGKDGQPIDVIAALSTADLTAALAAYAGKRREDDD